MAKLGVRSMLLLVLVLTLALFQTGSAQAKLTKNQKALMRGGRVTELARSLTLGSRGWMDKVFRLYSFVRDDIALYQFKERRAPTRVIMDGAGREEDQARLLSILMRAVNVRGSLATIHLVKYGEDVTYSFVVIQANRKEAEALSKATGGGGKFTQFPLGSNKNEFIPLVPLSGYYIGRLSPDFYEVNRSGQWKKWKYYVNLARF